jgi:very-short-patch-repair endonuclease/predicted transcriptional regulator of viral defense system
MDALEQTRAVDARIVELAERQHGVVGRRQLMALGVGREAIEVRLRGGRLHLLSPGVYAVGHRVLSREARWMAAVLACGTGAVLSHRSAAALWGIRPPGSRAIEVTAPAKSRSRGRIHRHFAVLPADEVTERERIPVTTVPRTILDLGAVERPEAVERALRQSEYLRLHDRLSLPDLLGRYPRRQGTRAVRAALARLGESPGRIESRFEERFLPFLDRHRLPRPEFNVWLEAGGHRYRVDCLWRARRQVVELDGWEGHGTRFAFRDDRARDRRLRVAGYGVMRLAWSQLDDEPEAVAADLRSLLSVQYKRS